MWVGIMAYVHNIEPWQIYLYCILNGQLCIPILEAWTWIWVPVRHKQFLKNYNMTQWVGHGYNTPNEVSMLSRLQ